MRLFPEGSRAVSTLLNAAADALVEGGRSGIFTPMFFFLARKPSRSGDQTPRVFARRTATAQDSERTEAAPGSGGAGAPTQER